MKIGFTGTQHGMNIFQQVMIKIFIKMQDDLITEVHHGDCIGSDRYLHNICELYKKKIVIHPPENDKKRAWCKSNFILESVPYIKRNHNIVDYSDVLIASPDGEEKLRSGTWSTIRYAKKKNKKIIIIYPNRIEIVKGK